MSLVSDLSPTAEETAYLASLGANLRDGKMVPLTDAEQAQRLLDHRQHIVDTAAGEAAAATIATARANINAHSDADMRQLGVPALGDVVADIVLAMGLRD